MSDSYSLDEVSSLLGVPVSDLIRRIEDGAFPGRFLTSDWEMRIPVQDVRKAVDTIRRSSPPRSMVPAPATAAVVPTGDGRELGSQLDAWWDTREAQLVEVLQGLVQREEARWQMVEDLLVEIRERLGRIEATSLAPLDWDGPKDLPQPSTPSSVREIFDELRDLERLLGLPEGDDSL